VSEGHEEASEGHEEASEGHEEATEGHEEASEGHEEASQGHEEASEGHEEASEGHEEASEGHEEASEGHEEASEGHEEVSEGHEEVSERRPEVNEARAGPRQTGAKADDAVRSATLTSGAAWLGHDRACFTLEAASLICQVASFGTAVVSERTPSPLLTAAFAAIAPERVWLGLVVATGAGATALSTRCVASAESVTASQARRVL
jgi:hypothetical protein